MIFHEFQLLFWWFITLVNYLQMLIKRFHLFLFKHMNMQFLLATFLEMFALLCYCISLKERQYYQF